jgi:hypothetical protein
MISFIYPHVLINLFLDSSASRFAMSSTPAIQQKSFQDAVKERRSIYALGRQLPEGVTDEKVRISLFTGGSRFS